MWCSKCNSFHQGSCKSDVPLLDFNPLPKFDPIKKFDTLPSLPNFKNTCSLCGGSGVIYEPPGPKRFGGSAFNPGSTSSRCPQCGR